MYVAFFGGELEKQRENIKKLKLLEKNKLKMLKYSLFLTFFGVIMSTKTLFEIPKNDFNRVRKKLQLNFLI
jgi:hypothetical protein